MAIKVLPEEFAKDTDRIARFQREAQLLASLNHPNIAANHGLEESSGTHFLILELIEGDTLADQIKKGIDRPQRRVFTVNSDSNTSKTATGGDSVVSGYSDLGIDHSRIGGMDIQAG